MLPLDDPEAMAAIARALGDEAAARTIENASETRFIAGERMCG
jgi:hypothetical protein